MNFGFEWLLFYCSIMFTMCVDNICWISASPEWPSVKKYSLKEKLIYVWQERIATVLTHPRDVIPAIFTSLILAVIW